MEWLLIVEQKEVLSYRKKVQVLPVDETLWVSGWANLFVDYSVKV